MRDLGLEEAIRVAGGVGALARKIGIAQPSVSNWSRVPAERVVSVEAATGVSRAVLRPDLYAEQAATDLDEVDAARAQEYALLSASARARPRSTRCSHRLAGLRGDASPLGARACRAVRRLPRRANVERSSANISISSSGSGAGNFCPMARIISPGFCTSGRWRGCAQHLARLGIERAAGQSRAGRSRRDPVRDHGRAGEPPLAGCRRCRSRTVRAASGAVDRALLRRPGAGRGGRLLSRGGDARPGVRRDRDRGLRAAA